MIIRETGSSVFAASRRTASRSTCRANSISVRLSVPASYAKQRRQSFVREYDIHLGIDDENSLDHRIQDRLELLLFAIRLFEALSKLIRHAVNCIGNRTEFIAAATGNPILEISVCNSGSQALNLAYGPQGKPSEAVGKRQCSKQANRTGYEKNIAKPSERAL